VYFYQFKLTKVCYLALPISEKNEKKRVDGAMNKPATLDKFFIFSFCLRTVVTNTGLRWMLLMMLQLYARF